MDCQNRGMGTYLCISKKYGNGIYQRGTGREDWDVVEELAKKHNIKVAVHKPSK